MFGKCKKEVTKEEYLCEFRKYREKAFNQALDIRKFEIELYWKRAAYFWAFIAASFVAYFAAQALDDASIKNNLSILVSCLGMVVSFAWVLVNKGSKFWQENWELHVSLLEEEIVGPLYATVLRKDDHGAFLVGPGKFSVSKINILTSEYIFILWILILFYSIGPIDLALQANWICVILVSISVVFMVLFFVYGRSSVKTMVRREN